MSEKVQGFREQQKAATREQLIQTAVALFLQQGFVNTRIEQIVEPLGMAKRTFFRYFETKEDLLFEWQDDKTAMLVSELLRRPADEAPITALCTTLSLLLKNYDESKQQSLAYIRLTQETPALIGRHFERRMDREEKLSLALVQRDKEMDFLHARILVGTVMAAWIAALDKWYQSRGEEDLRCIVKQAFSLINKQ